MIAANEFRNEVLMALKGKRVYVIRGINKGAYGIVTHADRDSLRLVVSFTDLDELGIYDRIVNVVKAKD